MKSPIGDEVFAVAESDAPNVVSSGAAASDSRHYVEALRMADGSDWVEVERVVASLSRRGRVVDGDGVCWLRAEFRSLVFRFVDDLWLKWEVGSGVINVKSASRVGYSDLGVNRRRVERLRQVLGVASAGTSG